MKYDEYDYCRICLSDFHMDQGEIIHGRFVCYDCKYTHAEKLGKAEKLTKELSNNEENLDNEHN